MRELKKRIDEFVKKIKSHDLTPYDEGFIDALEMCKEWVDETADSMIAVGNVYYVISYEYGNELMPEIQKLKLFKIKGNKLKTYFFSSDMNANSAKTRKYNLCIRGKTELRKRIFFTYEEALTAIDEKIKRR